MAVLSHKQVCNVARSSGTPPNRVASLGQHQTDQDGSTEWDRTHLKETWDGIIPPPARLLELFLIPELCHTTTISARVSAPHPTTETHAQGCQLDTPSSSHGL